MKITKTPKGYLFDWYQAGKRERKVFRAPSKEIAKQMYCKWIQGNLGLTATDGPSITKAIKDYLQIVTPQKQKASRYIDQNALRLLGTPCDKHKVNEIDERTISLLVKHFKEDLKWKASTINRNLNTVRNFLNWCFANGWIDKKVTVPRVRGYTRESRPLSSLELAQIWQHSNETLRAQIALALTFGLRRAEISSLGWNAIDFESGRVQIGGINGFQTKSGETRIVYLTEHTKQILVGLRSLQPLGSRWVFPSKDPNRPVLPGSISNQWKKMRKRAGLSDVKFHDLRATAATKFAENGHGDAHIASLLGHKTQAMARKYSNQVSETARRRAFEQNDSSFADGFSTETGQDSVGFLNLQIGATA